MKRGGIHAFITGGELQMPSTFVNDDDNRAMPRSLRRHHLGDVRPRHAAASRKAGGVNATVVED